MRRIDFEAHAYIPEYRGKMREILPGGVRNPMWDTITDLGEGRIAEMDNAGIDMQVLSFSAGIASLSAERAVPLCRTINDRLYQATQAYPTRFSAFAQLPEQDVPAACAELEWCMKELHFFGWNTFSNFGSKHLDDPEFYPLLEKAAELGAVVYLHPAFPTEDPRFQGWGRQLMGGLGYTLDTAITIIRLICSGVFDKLPDLKMILGHLGEGIPFYLDRMCGKSETPESKLPAVNVHDFRYYFEHNIWVTNSGNFSKPAYNCTRDVLGKERILFGSDYPYESMQEAVTFTDSVEADEKDLAGLYAGNAERIFRL